MSKIEIRKAILSDLESIQTIGEDTFMETFASVNAVENISNYIQESFNKNQLTQEINNPESIFYLAILDQTIIGYLKLNFGQSQTETMDENAMEVQRIYVLKEFHGKKVGQLLIDKVVEIAQLEKVSFVWLGVWEENHRAIGFYVKNGFIVFDKHVFTLGNDKQTDLLMKLEMKNQTNLIN